MGSEMCIRDRLRCGRGFSEENRRRKCVSFFVGPSMPSSTATTSSRPLRWTFTARHRRPRLRDPAVQLRRFLDVLHRLLFAVLSFGPLPLYVGLSAAALLRGTFLFVGPSLSTSWTFGSLYVGSHSPPSRPRVGPPSSSWDSSALDLKSSWDHSSLDPVQAAAPCSSARSRS